MGKIIAIGGADGQFNGTINGEIIRLTGKRNPKGLIIPTASADLSFYDGGMQRYFAEAFGCEMDSLRLCNAFGRPKPSSEVLERTIVDKILGADFIYVLGGDTRFMVETWKEHGVDEVLKCAYEQGIVLSGSSSGGICWFEAGNSDSERMYNPTAPLIRVDGLGLIPGLFCPHYTDESRQEDLKEMMRTAGGRAYGVDAGCAIEIVDCQYRILQAVPQAKGHHGVYSPGARLVFWENESYHEQHLPVEREFRPLDELTSSALTEN